MVEGECGSPRAGPPTAGSAAPSLALRLGSPRRFWGGLVGGAVGSLTFWFSVFFGGSKLRPGFFEGVW